MKDTYKVVRHFQNGEDMVIAVTRDKGTAEDTFFDEANIFIQQGPHKNPYSVRKLELVRNGQVIDERRRA